MAEDRPPDECTCEYDYRSPGVLYGISMMPTWVRLKDDPNCPTHGSGDTGGGE